MVSAGSKKLISGLKYNKDGPDIGFTYAKEETNPYHIVNYLRSNYVYS